MSKNDPQTSVAMNFAFAVVGLSPLPTGSNNDDSLEAVLERSREVYVATRHVLEYLLSVDAKHPELGIKSELNRLADDFINGVVLEVGPKLSDLYDRIRTAV